MNCIPKCHISKLKWGNPDSPARIALADFSVYWGRRLDLFRSINHNWRFQCDPKTRSRRVVSVRIWSTWRVFRPASIVADAARVIIAMAFARNYWSFPRRPHAQQSWKSYPNPQHLRTNNNKIRSTLQRHADPSACNRILNRSNGADSAKRIRIRVRVDELW